MGNSSTLRGYFHSFIGYVQSWVKQTQAAQADDPLCPLPPLWETAVEQQLQALPVPESRITMVRDRLTEAISAWQADPNAPNALVVLTSPVEPASTLIAAVLQESLPQITQVLHPISWQQRPANPLALKEQLISALAGIGPSAPEESGDEDDVDALGQRQTIVVLPPLETCFLRCIGGWQGIIWLRDQVGQQRQRFWFISCNTWAWSFLNCVCQVGAYFNQHITLPPLEPEAIKQWLTPLIKGLIQPPESEGQNSGGKVLNGQSGSSAQGNALSQDQGSAISSPESPSDPEQSPVDLLDSPLLSYDHLWSQLAGIAIGGSPVVAALWLHSLRIRQVDIPESSTPLSPSDPLPVSLQSLSPSLPSLPNLTADDYYVLHALMLHGPMTRSHLAMSLGQGESFVQVRVQTLRQAEVIRLSQGHWSIHPAHYPKLCTELSTNNFLVGKAS